MNMDGTSTSAGLAFIFAILMRVFLFDFMIAEGVSMLPDIRPGSVLLVGKLVYGLKLPGAHKYLIRWALPDKDDVVVFYTPSGIMAVKRCGELLDKKEFMALGDNSLQSFDSRSYGPVSVDRIIGKALVIRRRQPKSLGGIN
jgi:signal peptidase I